MMRYNFRVLLEPRGFIRIIQLVVTTVALATTVNFETVAEFEIRCPHFEKHIVYRIAYPFKMSETKFRSPHNCGDIRELIFKSYKFPFDFSSNVDFFVASSVMTMIYILGIIFIYVFMHRFYSTNPIFPVVDLVASGMMFSFCLIGSCAWAKEVSDIKYYSDPATVFPHIEICLEAGVCHTVSPPENFMLLDTSLSFGFANCLLWISSFWFIYKEIRFHTQLQPPTKSFQMSQQKAPETQGQDLHQGRIDFPNLDMT